MKKLYKYLAIIVVGLLVGPLSAAMADPAPTGVLIVELQTSGAGTGTAAQEFVELYNSQDAAVDITGWKLQYRAASKLPADTWPATSATTILCNTGSSTDCRVVVGGRSRVTLATSALGLVGAFGLNGGFADAGGQIRLVEPSGTVDDFIGYGSALDFETAVAPKPAGGESLKRKVDLIGHFIDTNNNLADFTLGCGLPSPADNAAPLGGTPDGCPIFELPPVQDPPVVEVPPEPDPPVSDVPPVETPTEPPVPADPPLDPLPDPIPPISTDPQPTTGDETNIPTQPPADTPVNEQPPLPPAPTYLPLQITEALPDPAAPQTDTADEFVELFNPNDQPVELSGYTLKTGTNFERSIVLSANTILPGQYYIVTSGSSTLSLVNSGTAVRLVDPLGVTVSDVPNYSQAVAGESWILVGDSWTWTTTPTPASANVQTNPIPPTEEQPPISGDEAPAPSDPATTNDPEVTPTYYPLVTITELLPNPASPGQDSTDEFIEIFNPNSEVVSLAGYQIQSGSDYRYKFTLPDISALPGQYVVIMSEESGLSLSNDGTQVRLLNPLDEVIDELANYGKATDGSSWSKASDGTWQWSTTPTPGQTNLVTLPPVKATKPVVAKSPKAKKATTAAKVKTASVAKADEPDAVEIPDTSEGNDPNYWLLAGVGSMAVGYGVYEYRQGIIMGVRKLWGLARGRVPED